MIYWSVHLEIPEEANEGDLADDLQSAAAVQLIIAEGVILGVRTGCCLVVRVPAWRQLAVDHMH